MLNIQKQILRSYKTVSAFRAETVCCILSVLHYKGETVGTLILCGICLVGADLYTVKAAKIAVAAVIRAVVNGTFNALVCSFCAHFISTPFVLFTDFVRDDSIPGVLFFIR